MPFDSPRAPEGAPDRAAAPGGAAAAVDEAEAWSRVLAAWEDEAAHKAYVARFFDLEGLAVAGGRYRAVLALRPDDAVAARFRDEVVKKATVVGLASLPRLTPRARPTGLGRRVLIGASVALGFAAAAVAWRLYLAMTSVPKP